MLFFRKHCLSAARWLAVFTSPLLCGAEVRIVGPTTAEEVVAETKGYGADEFTLDYLKSSAFSIKENETPRPSGM